MTDELLNLAIMITLWLGYLVNRWKIRDLEDRIEELERHHE